MTRISRAPSGMQARTTCSMSGRPPAWCSTLASCECRRVPWPAARMTMAKSLEGIGVLLSLRAADLKRALPRVAYTVETRESIGGGDGSSRRPAFVRRRFLDALGPERAVSEEARD